MMAAKCEEFDHLVPERVGPTAIPACHLDSAERVPFCQLRARRVRDCMRTDERTVLVRIHIPVD
jgi:hypothetical protein